MDAKSLNINNICQSLDPLLLKQRFKFDEMIVGRPNLFSDTTVFLSLSQFEKIKSIIQAVEEAIHTKQFQKNAFQHSPTVQLIDWGTKGVFTGYDFHIDEQGFPKLIEINTNSGGALINYYLAISQKKLSEDKNLFFNGPEDLLKLDRIFLQMFIDEWKQQRGDKKIGLLAIVDEHPHEQYLYLEFLLFQQLFANNGIESIIVDSKDLIFKDEFLLYEDRRIDFVYNRLTDFYLCEKIHFPLRMAYETGAAIITPSPWHYAIYANKLNLSTLTNLETLKTLGVSEKTIEILLTGIPKTEEVSIADQSSLWARRNKLFFKPITGFGSKAAYRGDKITHRVWDEILQGKFVAQELVTPSKRKVLVNNPKVDLKFDIRAYTYEGKIQLLIARLYSGQTTNFRTNGGGFAPVFVTKN